MNPSRIVQRAAWLFLGLSVASFVAGIFLDERFFCEPHGPYAFAAALVLCVLAFVSFAARAICLRSFMVGGGALLVALLAFFMWAAGIGMTLACGGT